MDAFYQQIDLFADLFRMLEIPHAGAADCPNGHFTVEDAISLVNGLVLAELDSLNLGFFGES